MPVVALTANAVAGTRELLLKEGFNDFLEKPIERSVLERVIKRNIPQSKIIEKSRKSSEDVKKTEETEAVNDSQLHWLEKISKNS